MKTRSALLLAALSASLLSSPCFGSADAPVVKATAILDGAATVPAANFVSYPVKVDFASMSAATISGYVQASGGTGNDIDVLVLSDGDFLNWKNGHPVSPLYDSGKVTGAQVFARPSASGTYYVVLSNKFSALSPKSIGAMLQLMWVPTTVIEGEQRSAHGLKVKLVVCLGALVAALVLLGFALAGSRKRKARAEPERKAA
jgi:hypothetical protein